jgi:hypothetical protein
VPFLDAVHQSTSYATKTRPAPFGHNIHAIFMRPLVLIIFANHDHRSSLADADSFSVSEVASHSPNLDSQSQMTVHRNVRSSSDTMDKLGGAPSQMSSTRTRPAPNSPCKCHQLCHREEQTDCAFINTGWDRATSDRGHVHAHRL